MGQQLRRWRRNARRTIRWEPAASWLVRRTPTPTHHRQSAQRPTNRASRRGARPAGSRQARNQHRQGAFHLMRCLHAPAKQAPASQLPIALGWIDQEQAATSAAGTSCPKMPASPRQTVRSGGSRVSKPLGRGRSGAPATRRPDAATIASFTASNAGAAPGQPARNSSWVSGGRFVRRPGG